MNEPDISKLVRSIDGIERIISFGAKISERELAKQQLSDIRKFLIQCEQYQDRIIPVLAWPHAWNS